MESYPTEPEYPTGPSANAQPDNGEVGDRGIIKKVAVVGAATFLGYQGLKFMKKRKKHAHASRGIDSGDVTDEYEWVDERGNVVEPPTEQQIQAQYASQQQGYCQPQGYPQYPPDYSQQFGYQPQGYAPQQQPYGQYPPQYQPPPQYYPPQY